MGIYQVKTIVMPTGERLPILVDLESGQPDYWSTVYSLTQHRSKGQAVATIERILRDIMFLKVFLQKQGSQGINLDERLNEGLLLHLYEIESLTDVCKLYLKDLSNSDHTQYSNPINLISYEKFRTSSPKKHIATVDPHTTAIRITTIRDFLVWLANTHLAKLFEDDKMYSKLKESRDFLQEHLTSRIPKISKSSLVSGREGMSDEELNLLFKMVAHESPDNPWKSKFTRIRNELLLTWLYEYGLRRSELLNLKVTDIDFKTKTFLVLRRADDPTDPRKNQPLVKTLGRKLAMTEKVAQLTLNYIIHHRAKLPHAKSHEFLMVADKTGSPMTTIAVNKVFEQLRAANSDLPRDMSPHILRHSWNDRFSALMEKKNISEDQEKKTRSYLMGWSENSNSATKYTKRHTRKKANEVILEMGNEMTGDTLPDFGDSADVKDNS